MARITRNDLARTAERMQVWRLACISCWCLAALHLGSAMALAEPTRWLPWPIQGPFHILNTVSTLQFYGPQPGFHHGLDMQAPAGTLVYAPIGGKVGLGYYYPRVQNAYTYQVFIEANDGFRWEFHHVDPQSIPEAIRTLAEAGGTVAPGAVLAQIVDTTHVAPQIPPHVHINVIDQEGRYYNPLHFFPRLPDALAPVLVGVYVVDPTNQVVAGGSPTSIFDEIIAPGAYELVLDIIDQIPPAMHGEAIYKLVVSANGVLLGKVEFDRLPANNYLAGVSDIYKLEPIRLRDGRLLTNQVDLATPRKFLYRFPFQTEKFSNATTDRVRVAIEAADYAGNTMSATVELKLR